MRSQNVKIAIVFLLAGLLAAAAWGAYRLRSARHDDGATIALIPRGSGALLWDLAHAGATSEAQNRNLHLYWNSPTSETDIAGQASLLDRVARGNHRGLIFAPNHSYFPLSAMKRVLAAKIPVVVISDPLDLPPSPIFTQVLNDNVRMGEMAAAALASHVKSGPVAIIGLSRYAPGVLKRLHAAEAYLRDHHPKIQVVTRISSAYVSARAEEYLRAELEAHPTTAGVLGLSASASRGALAALKSVNSKIPLIACEQDGDLLTALAQGDLAAIVAADTREMGRKAVQFISAHAAGEPMPPPSRVAPVLLTRDNAGQASTKPFVSPTP